jgi:cold shock CspA family protein/ribosome-associated translation inhibitor RaiA
MDPSPAVRSWVVERVAWLERFFQPIISCRVAIEAPHRHHRRGNLFRVRVVLRVPGGQLVVSRRPDLHAAHKDAYVALRDAFDEARRGLEEFARVKRREVKVPLVPERGRVLRLLHEGDGEGYGFIGTRDGREIYFNAHSVLGHRFERLRTGDPVIYVEEAGLEGPQASSVEALHPIVRRNSRRAA